MRIHCRFEADEPHRSRLLQRVPGLTFGERIPDPVDVLVHGVPTDAELACITPNGSLVVPYAGLATSTRDRLLERPDVAVYNLHHNAGLVAEHTVGLLLAVVRQIVSADAAMRRGDWRIRYGPDPSPRLFGKRALILGYGAIGHRVGTTLEALGMEVVGIRRTQPPTLADVDALLPETRALIVTLPHTPATDRWIDARRLARLPRDAVVVNVGRGRVIDEDALFEALQSRQLLGAGIDVWWDYPTSPAARGAMWPRRPFHELDNVVLSPHRGAHGAETEALRFDHLAEVLATLAAGGTPDTRVDPGEGY
ncbi:MAG: NAD(P)-dependent oxidoreductase [Myxococcota bacterium]